MAYIRKTRDVFVVQGLYSGPHDWEDVCQSYDRKEARGDLRSYRENEPQYQHRMVKRRERITTEAGKVASTRVVLRELDEDEKDMGTIQDHCSYCGEYESECTCLGEE